MVIISATRCRYLRTQFERPLSQRVCLWARTLWNVQLTERPLDVCEWPGCTSRCRLGCGAVGVAGGRCAQPMCRPLFLLSFEPCASRSAHAVKAPSAERTKICCAWEWWRGRAPPSRLWQRRPCRRSWWIATRGNAAFAHRLPTGKSSLPPDDVGMKPTAFSLRFVFCACLSVCARARSVCVCVCVGVSVWRSVSAAKHGPQLLRPHNLLTLTSAPRGPSIWRRGRKHRPPRLWSKTCCAVRDGHDDAERRHECDQRLCQSVVDVASKTAAADGVENAPAAARKASYGHGRHRSVVLFCGGDRPFFIGFLSHLKAFCLYPIPPLEWLLLLLLLRYLRLSYREPVDVGDRCGTDLLRHGSVFPISDFGSRVSARFPRQTPAWSMTARGWWRLFSRSSTPRRPPIHPLHASSLTRFYLVFPTSTWIVSLSKSFSTPPHFLTELFSVAVIWIKSNLINFSSRLGLGFYVSGVWNWSVFFSQGYTEPGLFWFP